MSQSHRHSIIEAISNVIIGYSVSLISQIFIFGMNGIHIDLMTNIRISIWFTIISLIRSYVLRRVFNKITIHSMRQLKTES